jgi:hypothetical protein
MIAGKCEYCTRLEVLIVVFLNMKVVTVWPKPARVSYAISYLKQHDRCSDNLGFF